MWREMSVWIAIGNMDVFEWLCTIFAILLAISVVTFVRIIVLTAHSPIGVAHGKIGFLFILFCIGHTAKRWKWVKKQLNVITFHLKLNLTSFNVLAKKSLNNDSDRNQI